MAVPLEDDDGEVVDVDSLRLGDPLEVLRRRRLDVDCLCGFRADRDLVHVERGAREEHRPPLRNGDDRDRSRHAESGQPRPLEGVDGDVDLRPRPVTHLLAVVEHRRLVLLPLADDDDTSHGDGVEEETHRVHGRLVGGDLVAAPDPARREGRGSLRHPDELEREVAVRG
ncbi:MAG: hypothetical protein NZL88_05455 [Gaiellaceae bacterium]|nr:hypothetical protein [Gaiellaceae bacterium]